MLLLFGTGVACLALMTHAASPPRRSPPPGYQSRSPDSLYIVGVVLMTGLYHVPRNNLLWTVLDPGSAEGIAYWATYLEEWVRMNHVRTLAPLAAAVLLVVSLRVE